MKIISKIEELSGYCHGEMLFDFKLDAFGTLSLEFDCPLPSNVEVSIGEVADGGRLQRSPGGFRYAQNAQFELRPGVQHVSFPIPQHRAPNPALPKCFAPPEAAGEIAPFRYVEIRGATGRVRLRRHVYHAPFDDQAAEFECSDPNLNRIWNFCKYSIKATTAFGKYIDGERERLPYEGDAYINQLGHFCCDSNYELAAATIEHIMAHPTWPAEWRLLTPILVRDYLLYSGDAKLVGSVLPLLPDRLLPELREPNGLIRDDSVIRNIIDWPTGERDHYEFGRINFVPNCYLHAALHAMHELTGDDEYRRQAKHVREALHREMYRDGRFTDNPDSAHTSLHTAAFAIAFGVAGSRELPALCDIIRERGMACSVYAAQFLLEACFRAELPGYAQQLMTASGLRSWNNMLARGTTITMEAWDDSLKPNQDWTHAWGAAPANIITRELCGIKPVSPGFDCFAVTPCPGSLAQFRVRQPTRHGAIELTFDRGDYSLTVPSGSRALVSGRELPPGTHRFSR